MTLAQYLVQASQIVGGQRKASERLGRTLRASAGSRAFMPVLAAACLSVFALAGTAAANILQISATGFVLHCNCLEPDFSNEEKGVIFPQQSPYRLFSPVVFPVDGQNVCSFSVVYQDKNGAENLAATLKRKRFSLGNDALVEPIVMASVQSADGVSDAARRARTRDINQPKINAANSFYYVEINGNVNHNLLGVQIDVRPTCPLP